MDRGLLNAMIAAPMTQHLDGARPGRWLAGLALTLALVLASCGPATPSPSPSAPAPSVPSATPSPSPTPDPTPEPTARDTNPADPALAALIPDEVAGQTVDKPPVTDFAFTPADVGPVFGEIGMRFTAVQVAFITPRKLSLYAMRMSAPFARTLDLEPYLAAAGEFVGIAGLHREPWHLTGVAGHTVWVRPEDNATAAGTMIYTWATNGYVFLMIGTDDTLNQAMLAALPGEPPPTPSPSPSPTVAPSSSVAPLPSATGS